MRTCRVVSYPWLPTHGCNTRSRSNKPRGLVNDQRSAHLMTWSYTGHCCQTACQHRLHRRGSSAFLLGRLSGEWHLLNSAYKR